MVYVLFNDYAGHSQEENKKKIRDMFPGEEVVFSDVVTVDDKMSCLRQVGEDDKVVIMGGDGTLNHFVNAIDETRWEFPIYCYAGGTGNDFLNDVAGSDDKLIQINDYIYNLPTVEVNGETYKFLNGIGYGIDGYACEIGDKVKKAGKNPNYTIIALKGLLGAFTPCHAKVTVDGVTEEYDNVWLAPTMHGRYFGGGMMIAPNQDRRNPENTLSIVVASCKSRLRLLTMFPKIFKGTHLKYEKYVKVRTGKSVSIEFDTPCALQIDGETILGVESYKAYACAPKEEKEPATV